MSDVRSERWIKGGGTAVFLMIAFPLWKEFREPGHVAWNGFLTVLIAGLAVSALFLQRYFSRHIGEIGEARFDTRNKTNG